MFDGAGPQSTPSISTRVAHIRSLLASALKAPAAARVASLEVQRAREELASVDGAIKEAVSTRPEQTEDSITSELAVLHDGRDAALVKVERAKTELSAVKNSGSASLIGAAERQVALCEKGVEPYDRQIAELVAARVALGKRVPASDPGNLAALARLREETSAKIARAKKERAAALEAFGPKFLEALAPVKVVAAEGILDVLEQLDEIVGPLVDASYFATNNGLPAPRLVGAAPGIAALVRQIRVAVGDRA